jgi:hypothetical protein
MTPEQMEAAELAGTLKRLDEWRRDSKRYGRRAELTFDGAWVCRLPVTKHLAVTGEPHVLLHLAIESALLKWREPEGGK